MSKVKTLEKYTAAMLAVAEYRKKHAKFFDEYDVLRLAVTDAEAALKEDVKDNLKMNVANEHVRVTYSPAFSKGYNVKTILEKVSPAVKKKLYDLKAIVVEEKADKKKIEEAVEQGIIPVDVKQAAFEEKELAPRVTIKEVDHEQE
jgi:hypothetical protein